VVLPPLTSPVALTALTKEIDMPAKKTSNQPSIAQQQADVKRQQAELKAQAAKLREQAAALRPAKAIKTLAQVIDEQNAEPQKYIVRSIAGRVLERVQHGQDEDTALGEVLEQVTVWTRQELARRAAAKTARAEKVATAE
jgi:hypothetical protein